MVALSRRSYCNLIALTLCLYAAPACAGFITITVESDHILVVARDPVMTQKVTDDTPYEAPGDCPQLLDAAITVPIDGTSSGMGGSASDRSPSVPAHAIAEHDSRPTGQIATYLIAFFEGELPVPFLSGVFRPPRQIVGSLVHIC
jgi:hypothetical protein